MLVARQDRKQPQSQQQGDWGEDDGPQQTPVAASECLDSAEYRGGEYAGQYGRKSMMYAIESLVIRLAAEMESANSAGHKCGRTGRANESCCRVRKQREAEDRQHKSDCGRD